MFVPYLGTLLDIIEIVMILITLGLYFVFYNLLNLSTFKQGSRLLRD